MFFISFDKALFFIKVYRYPEVPFNRHVLAFFETSDFKEVRILFFNSTILIPKLTLKRQGVNLLTQGYKKIKNCIHLISLKLFFVKLVQPENGKNISLAWQSRLFFSFSMVSLLYNSRFTNFYIIFYLITSAVLIKIISL